MLSFHVKFVQTDRRTMVKQYVPDLSMGGHKNTQTLSMIDPSSDCIHVLCCLTLIYEVRMTNSLPYNPIL